jgi:hypothetical protein
MVADAACDALLLLLTKLANIPVVIFAASITKHISVHWLLYLGEHTKKCFSLWIFPNLFIYLT